VRVATAGSVTALGVVYMPVVTHSHEHIALARPGEFLMASFHPLMAQPTRSSSSTPTARAHLLHKREVRQLDPGRIGGAQRRHNGVRVGRCAAGERHIPEENAITQARNSDEAYLEIS